MATSVVPVPSGSVTKRIKPVTTRPTMPAAVPEATWNLLGIMCSVTPPKPFADTRSRFDNLARNANTLGPHGASATAVQWTAIDSADAVGRPGSRAARRRHVLRRRQVARRHRTLPGCSPGGASRSRRSRRRTCRTTRWSAPTASEIGRAQYLQAQAAGVEPDVGDEPGAAQAGLRPARPRRRARPAGGHPGGRRVRDGRAAPGRGGLRGLRRARRRASSWSSARARGRPPRSTCAPATTSTWAWPAGSACRWSWSATSTAAGSSPPCTARARCSTTADRALIEPS